MRLELLIVGLGRKPIRAVRRFADQNKTGVAAEIEYLVCDNARPVQSDGLSFKDFN